MIDQFISEHVSYNNLTPGRASLLRRSLEAFASHAGRPPHRVDRQQFEEFLIDEIARGQSPTTVKTTAHAITPFFTWAWRQGHIDAERYMRLRDVPMPRQPADAGLPRPYSRKELARFWAAFDARWPRLKRPSTWKRWKDGRAKWARCYPHAMRLQIDTIVSLALHCGLRKNEIWKVTLDDIHYDNEWIVVQGKGGRHREVPHTDHSRSAVYAWIQVLMDIAPSHDRPWLTLVPTATPNSIMPSHPFNPMNSRRFEMLLSTIPGAGKGDDHWQYHRLRHTCATEWLRAGMPIEQVSRLLGHSSLQMTLRYAQVIRDDVHRTAAQHMGEFERAVGSLDGG